MLVQTTYVNSFRDLSKKDQEALLKFPVYISLLAAISDDKYHEVQIRSAIKFAHIKTYSCNPLLSDFYSEVDKSFEKNIQELDNELPKERQRRISAIKNELVEIEKILSKLGRDYRLTMHKSMKSFKEHVSKAHRNILEYFIFPLPIKGITD
jgi:hypothetical protein